MNSLKEKNRHKVSKRLENIKEFGLAIQENIEIEKSSRDPNNSITAKLKYINYIRMKKKMNNQNVE